MNITEQQLAAHQFQVKLFISFGGLIKEHYWYHPENGVFWTDSNYCEKDLTIDGREVFGPFSLQTAEWILQND